jgi:hypothetical protein
MKKQVVDSLNWALGGYHHLKQPFEQIVLHIVHDDEHGQFSLLVFLLEQPVKNNILVIILQIVTETICDLNTYFWCLIFNFASTVDSSMGGHICSCS